MGNYFRNHPWYNQEVQKLHKNNFFIKYNSDLHQYVKDFNKDKKILEIWSGMWNFAYFCQTIWVKNYTWIDIDDYFFETQKYEYPNYIFLKESFQNHLENNSYDIIFVSHVFEHLNEIERKEMINCIYNWLTSNWIWINYTPNADSILSSNRWRYTDITHYTMYNTMSFEQLCNSILWEKPFSLQTINSHIGTNLSKRIIHKVFLLFTRIYYLGMWVEFPTIYTWEMINILRKHSWKN